MPAGGPDRGLQAASPQSLRGSDTDRSLERRKIGGFKRPPKEVKHWLDAVGVWTQQQDSRMFAWRIDTDVTESLVGSDEKPALILDGLPNQGITPTTHLLFHNRLRVIEASLPQ